MNIYQIDKELEALIDPETGELKDEEAFINLKMEREQKVSGLVRWIANIKAGMNAKKNEVERLKSSIKKDEADIERLEAYIGNAVNHNKYITDLGTLSFRKSVRCDVDKGTELPKEYVRVKITKTEEPDKAAIKKALESGIELAGCRLTDNYSMSIK